MNKESKLNLNASVYAISHCDCNKTYNGLEVHKMLCDAYIAGNNDTLNDKDEKIRKALINVFATHKDYEVFFGVSVEDIHAWLEKQSEQKPVDKVGHTVVRDFNSVFSREQVEEIDKRIKESQRLYNAKLRDAMRKVEDFPMTD